MCLLYLYLGTQSVIEDQTTLKFFNGKEGMMTKPFKPMFGKISTISKRKKNI